MDPMAAKEFVDREGIFRYYRDRFFPAHVGDAEFEWHRVMGLLTAFQRLYNRISDKPCVGLAFMDKGAKNGSTNRCRQPLCPACWHRRNVELLRAIRSIDGWPHYYIRSTWNVKWTHALHPRCVQRLKGTASSYKLIGYTLNYDACSPEITEEIAKRDVFQGELSYQVIGAFVSDALVRDKHMRGGQLHVFEHNQKTDGKVVGVIDREEHPSPASLRESWLDQLHHPWLYRAHPKFEDYILRFNVHRPTGRSWTRVSTDYKLGTLRL